MKDSLEGTIVNHTPDAASVAECRQLKQAGADRERIIAFLRSRGLSRIETIAVLREAYDISLKQARQAVHVSAAWTDRRQADDETHERLADLTEKN